MIEREQYFLGAQSPRGELALVSGKAGLGKVVDCQLGAEYPSELVLSARSDCEAELFIFPILNPTYATSLP
jgi:hypothetical protein